MNVVVLVGTLSRAPEARSLPSGDHVLHYEVTTRRPSGVADSVPVVWPGPPARAGGEAVGDEVAVLGRARRRFFRSGGVTQSRTEVVAEAVVPARRGRQVASLLARAAARLEPGS